MRGCAVALAWFGVCGAAPGPCVVEPAVHAFYYLWYGTPATDGRWMHWDHAVLPHWTAAVRARYAHLENHTYAPPEELHAPFYPALGPYSSRDPAALDAHFAQMRRAGVDAAVLGWTGRPGGAVSDTQGVGTDAAVAGALAAAARAGVGAAIHLEPYAGRGAESARADLAHLVARYGDGLYRLARRPCGGGPPLPVVYVYDAYHTPAAEWARVFCPGGDLSVALATLLGPEDRELVERGCFDGAYTYFATDGFTHGATSANWKSLAAWARARGLWFSPSAGPGYDDTKIRPWNGAATRDRRGGAYFRAMLTAAAASGADLVSITSFNEWGEGTQIEPSRDYGGAPDLYLDVARDVAARWRGARAAGRPDL